MDKLARLFRHLFSTAARTRVLFSAAVLAQIEAAIGTAEAQHSGEIRFVVETALPLSALWHDLTPRARALQVFAHLRIWDTHANNGVLIYVLRADRAVEILADRGISAQVSEAEWQAVCREVEVHFRAGRYAQGASVAVAGVAGLLGQHFPPGGSGSNELPNQPILL
ncbi:MAG TPA: TPM domain-containing protein [Steroidobacteraceae bacterium]|jgi:uncharacterized membrane protein